MSKKLDYVPRRDADFDQWFKNLIQYTEAKCSGSRPEWKHIPKTAIDELKKAYDTWSGAYAAVQKPHTPAETTAKNTAKSAAIKMIIRPFVQPYIRFGPLMEADYVNLKIPVRDRSPRPIARPERPPVFTVKPKGERFISVDYREEGKASRARPYGSGGAVVYWAVLDKVPESASELVDGKLSTRTPCVIEFKENQRGKRVYIAVCWQNNKGEQGPVSGIQMAIVP